MTSYSEDIWFKPQVFTFDPKEDPRYQASCEDCHLAPTPETPVTLIPLGLCCYTQPLMCLPCLKKRVADLEGGDHAAEALADVPPL